MSADKSLAAPETNELLQRILDAVEPAARKRGIEIACAIILALTTTASAWCAYQSKVWGGAQMARANAAIWAGRQQAVATLAAQQARVFDASMFIAYMRARLEGDQATEDFLAVRFRPEMKRAVEAWFRLDPLNDTAAPPSPLQMAEYAQPETAEADRQEAVVAGALQGVREARQYSDNYVLLTVLFASVLFFGGIARTFDSRVLRTVLAALAILLFMGTLAGLLNMPVCHE